MTENENTGWGPISPKNRWQLRTLVDEFAADAGLLVQQHGELLDLVQDAYSRGSLAGCQEALFRTTRTQVRDGEYVRTHRVLDHLVVEFVPQGGKDSVFAALTLNDGNPVQGPPYSTLDAAVVDAIAVAHHGVSTDAGYYALRVLGLDN